MTTTTCYLPVLGYSAIVSGTVTPETAPYWARDPGVMCPGDASAVEDITITPESNGDDPPLPASLDFDALAERDKDRVIDALVDAASEDGKSYHYERGERQSDARREMGHGN